MAIRWAADQVENAPPIAASCAGPEPNPGNLCRPRSSNDRIREFGMQSRVAAAPRVDDLNDMALVQRARNQDQAAFRLIMQRHNRRLYRIARSVLRDESEAEDTVQETYMRAFTHLREFRGDARLSTWLTRIALNEALGRLRQRRPAVELKHLDTINEQGEARVIVLPTPRQGSDPEAAAARSEFAACSNAPSISCRIRFGSCSSCATSRR
jgi:RNA polymerase sigma factor (sigma-70 family)